MEFRNLEVILLLAIGLVIAQSAESQVKASGAGGILLEAVGPESALEKAGLLAGDVLLSWDREVRGANGEFLSWDPGGKFVDYAQWIDVEIDKAPRGDIRVHGIRGIDEFTAVIKHGPWNRLSRPLLEKELEEKFIAGQELLGAEHVKEGIFHWEALAEEISSNGGASSTWLYLRIGRALNRRKLTDQELGVYKKAIGLARKPQDRALLLEKIGAINLELGSWDEAEKALKELLDIRLAEGPENLAITVVLSYLGMLCQDRDGDGAAESQRYYNWALAVAERNAPGSLVVAKSLNNLGAVAMNRGKYAEAYDLFQSALKIYQKSAPDSRREAGIQTNLAELAKMQGFLDVALGHARRSRDLQDKLEVKGIDLVVSRINLGAILTELNLTAEARQVLGEALDLLEETYAQSEYAATALTLLGRVEYVLGDKAAAIKNFESAAEIRRQLMPESLRFARSLLDVATVKIEFGNYTEAEPGLLASLSLIERTGHGTVSHVRVLGQLRALYQMKGDYNKADYYAQEALKVLDRQLMDLGLGSESRALMRNQWREIYEGAISLMVSAGRPEAAFIVSERFRAGHFLNMLERRKHEISKGSFGERANELAELKRSVVVYREQISRISSDEDEARVLAAKIQAAEYRRAVVESEIEREDPRLAELLHPRQIELQGLVSRLDSGTLALSYFVGMNSVFLLTLDNYGETHAFELPVGPADLAGKVSEFRRLIMESRERSSILDERMRRVMVLAQDLYDDLILPAEVQIASAERLLVIPDSFLHYLPFVALSGKTSGATRVDSLLQTRPMFFSLSVSVYNELKERGRDSDIYELADEPVVLLAPVYSATGSSSLVALGSGAVRTFTYLSGTLAEVTNIASLFPGANTHLLIGEAAREEAVKSIGTKARLIHVASHAFLDGENPEASYVALAPPQVSGSKDDGRLEALEIIESVDLVTDLLVLSACETGIGKDYGGEGLASLARAFQLAGADSVLGSLWAVDDEATARFMIAFYRNLKAGLSKASALRAAQRELSSDFAWVVGEGAHNMNGDLSSPYYWAAFQLYGEWQ